jgi:chaperonin GroES
MSDVVMNTDWHTDNDIADPTELPIPCGFRMLIRPVAPVKKTQGGIILTDKTVEDQSYLNNKGRVIAMGNECYDKSEKPWCKTGDYVVYGRYAGSKIDVSGVKMLLLNDDEVLAVLPNPNILTTKI